MKFKTKEELRKVRDLKVPQHKFYYNSGLSDAFESFAERVEFYKKYLYNPIEFYFNIPFKDLDITRAEFREKYCSTYTPPLSFSAWLFDYCFKDVIE